MAELKGTQVAAIVVPFTDADKYATHDAEYGKGGFRSVETIALRNAIPTERKTKGMVVRVNETGLHYYWNGSAWTEWLPKGTMLVDAMFDSYSTNPVQNKVITTRINEHAAKFDDIYSKIENIPTITIDTALSTTSTNPVQNKVITAKTNSIEVSVANLTSIVNKIPIITVDTRWNATSNNPASSKAIESTISPIRTTANSANAKANSALTTANNAIPKSYIDTTFTDSAEDTRVPSTKLLSTSLLSLIADFNSSINRVEATADSAKSTAEAAIPKSYIDDTMPENPVATRVPSTKLLGTVSAVANTAKSTADSAMTAANSAGSVANAAIPKSWIDSSIDGTETSNNSVPGSKAIVDYVKTQRSAIDISLNTVTGRLNTIESWKNTIGTKGAANGVASLDSGGKIPASQLPAGYDNVDMLQSFVTTNPSSNMQIGQKFYNTTTKKIFTATSATTGVETAVEGGDKIYINITENKSYRWTGATMVAVGDGSGVALGTTSSTAFRGDYGNTLYTNFGSGINLQGTKDARDFFYNMSLFDSLGNTSILKNLVVQPKANFVRLQNDIVYLIGEVNTGDGYDIPAATTTKAGVMTADMYKTLQEIELATFPLSLTASGGGTFEVGSSNKNAIGIIVTRKGTDVTSSSTITVTASGSVTGSLSSDKKTWTPSTNISSKTSVAVKATYGSQSATQTVNYTFKYKKYWGTSTNASLSSTQVLTLAGSTWADSKAMGATTFDCTGGKYVYYVIPSSLGVPEFWVGGLKNTDVVITNANVTNASGGSTTYQIMRLANIQTGVLSVEFK